MAIFLTACSNEEEPVNDRIPTNMSGYPIISGIYSFKTKDFQGCGNRHTNNITLDFTITQDGNKLTAINSSIKSVPGITMLKTTGAKGELAPSLLFSIEEKVAAKMKGWGNGIAYVTYKLQGSFTKTGWSGTYQYESKAPIGSGTCKYETTFTGVKHKDATTIKKAPDDSIFYKFEVVDHWGGFNKIAVSVGLRR